MGSVGASHSAALSRRLQRVVAVVSSWTARTPGVRAVAVAPSRPGSPSDHFSDLELLLLPTAGAEMESLIGSLASELEAVARLDLEERIVLYTREPPTKVELTFVSSADAPGPIEAPGARGPPDLLPRVLFAKDAAARVRLEADPSPVRFSAGADRSAKGASAFLYAYESFHPAFHRTDHLEAYFRYTVAFHELGEFLNQVYGVRAPIDPRGRLLDALDAVDPQLRKRFDTCAPEWVHDLTPLLLRKELMFDLLETALAERPASSPPTLDTARAIREYVRRRYPPLLRWRDLGGRGGLRPHRLYRAARLDRYPAEVLNRFLRSEGIRTVIDLRTDEELASRRYAPGALDGFRYVRIPVWPSTPYAPGANEVERLRSLYGRILDDPSFPSWMERFLAEISGSETLPMVVHCYAGADRTGILVATLLSLAGASDEDVIEDYLITSSHVKREYIETFLDGLRSRGGARPFLEGRGVPGRLIDHAIHVLVSG